jgi:hypothetical protein
MANSNGIMDKLFIKGTLGRHYLALFFFANMQLIHFNKYQSNGIELYFVP